MSAIAHSTCGGRRSRKCVHKASLVALRVTAIAPTSLFLAFSGSSVLAAIAVNMLLVAAAIAILERRVRGMEVVA